MQFTTIGLDIAKSVFQVHGIDAAEKVVVRKQLRRRQVLEFFSSASSCPNFATWLRNRNMTTEIQPSASASA
jgi:hypothetical protein